VLGDLCEEAGWRYYDTIKVSFLFLTSCQKSGFNPCDSGVDNLTSGTSWFLCQCALDLVVNLLTLC
jgi:hypothetical protein